MTEFRTLCNNLSIRGRILIAQEGINGALSGTTESIRQFQKRITEYEPFEDLSFREQEVPRNVYHKLVVRCRKEMVVFGVPVDLTKKGTYLSPEQLQQWYDRREDFVILDARNEYESVVGKFKGARTLSLRNFRDFASASTELGSLKNKKIVTYCTGGVRCEKVSAFLKQEGFKDVYQLQGGIINYVNQFPSNSGSRSSYFEGSCFVFDDRLVAKGSDDNSDAISICSICDTRSDAMINCHNLDCDKLVISCAACQKELKQCCSRSCAQAPRQREDTCLGTDEKETAEKDEEIVVGYVENYYAQKGVASIKLEAELAKDTRVTIKGVTTPRFEQSIVEIRDEEGKQQEEVSAGHVISIAVKQRIRKNDTLLLARTRS